MPKHKVILEATIKAILDTSDGVQLQFHRPDGKHLATASEDGTVKVYALGIRELLKLARSRVTRDFTPDECKRHFQSGTCLALP